MNIEALCAAPPEALAHSPSQMPLSCPVAPGRPKLMPGCGPAGRRALAHADTPNTSPGCRSCASAPSPAGARPRPPARALACRRAHVAGLQTSPRCRRELRTSPGCRPRRASRPRTRYKELMKKPFAWSQPSFSAPHTSFAASSAASCATSFTCSVGGGARVLGLGFPAAGRRLGTMRTVTRPSRHRRRPTPRPSRARPSRVAQGSGQNARKMSRKPSLGLPHQQRVQRALRDDEETVRVGSRRVRSGPTLRVLGLQIAYLEVK